MQDTIVALSTPPCVQAADVPERRDVPRAVIRLSGPRALPIAETVFEAAPPLTQQVSARKDGARVRKRVTGTMRWAEHGLAAYAYIMRAPHSYTREDVVELHVQAVPWAVSHIVERLLAGGARLAEPGEFTRRAFLNGRISLEQAEVVGALIGSTSADEARAFAARLPGRAHANSVDLRAQIEELLALIEFGMDFSHEDAGVLPPEEILRRVEHLRVQAASAAQKTAGASGSAALNAGLPRILLFGPSGAGKSSLFNALLGRDAAIVGAQRHTTRDFLEATRTFRREGDCASALLIDSAGCVLEPEGDAQPLRTQDSALSTAVNARWLRQAAWNATLAVLRTADVVLLTIDGSAVLPDAELALLRRTVATIKPAALAVVRTKADLPAAAEQAVLPEARGFPVSSATHAGLPALEDFLAEEVLAVGARIRSAALAAQTSARDASARAAAALGRAAAALEGGHGEDAAALELREALHAFWQAEGIFVRHDGVTEALLDRIFSRFCVGK